MSTVLTVVGVLGLCVALAIGLALWVAARDDRRTRLLRERLLSEARLNAHTAAALNQLLEVARQARHSSR